MKTVWKYLFEIATEVTIPMPKGARVIDVRIQNGKPCMWAIVNTEARIKPITFEIRGTGHDLDGVDEYDRVGTIHDTEKGLVWHVFQV